MNLNALIIEDEENSQELLHNILSNFCEGVTVIGLCKTVTEGVRLIKKLRPDIVFLDIELQDGKGFEILDQFSEKTFLTIFITGYDTYGIEAIKHEAFDYMLKPFAIKELQEILLKAKERVKGLKILHKIENGTTVLLEEEGKIILKTGKSTKVIPLNDIIHLDFDDPYSRIHLVNDTFVYIEERMKNILAYLPDCFFRIHKSHIINLNMVKAWDNGRGGNVTMLNNVTLPISYRKKKEFKEKFKVLKLN